MQMPLAFDPVKRGWLEVDGIRACVMEIENSLFLAREEIRAFVGDAEAEIFYRIGARDGSQFVRFGVACGKLTADRDGFHHIIEQYVRGGLGDFAVVEEDWAQGFAVVEATDAFEGWCYVRNHSPQTVCRCDYARGVLA